MSSYILSVCVFKAFSIFLFWSVEHYENPTCSLTGEICPCFLLFEPFKLRDSLCWRLSEGETCQSSFVQPTWNDVSSNHTPVESCQTTMSRVKTVGWQDRVGQDLPNVILLVVFVTVCVLVGVSVCMCMYCMYVCLTIKFRGCPDLHFLLSVITNLSSGVLSLLLHFVAFVQTLVNFDGMHSLSFLQFCSQTASTVKVIPSSPQIRFSWSLD